MLRLIVALVLLIVMFCAPLAEVSAFPLNRWAYIAVLVAEAALAVAIGVICGRNLVLARSSEARLVAIIGGGLLMTATVVLAGYWLLSIGWL